MHTPTRSTLRLHVVAAWVYLSPSGLYCPHPPAPQKKLTSSSTSTLFTLQDLQPYYRATPSLPTTMCFRSFANIQNVGEANIMGTRRKDGKRQFHVAIMPVPTVRCPPHHTMSQKCKAVTTWRQRQPPVPWIVTIVHHGSAQKCSFACAHVRPCELTDPRPHHDELDTHHSSGRASLCAHRENINILAWPSVGFLHFLRQSKH